MPFDKQLPTWLKTGTKPPDNILNTDGWKPGDKPPADWLNWFFNTVFLNLQELQQEAAEKASVYTKGEVDILDDQAEANVTNWVKSFGLGGNSPALYSDTNLNSIVDGGFYRLDNPINSPIPNTYGGLIVMGDNDFETQQIAIDVITKTIHFRVKSQSVWQPWKQIATTDLGTTSAPGLLQLVDSITSADATKAATANSVKMLGDWVKGYGLGDVAKDVTATDLNNLDATGFYRGNNLTNAPLVASVNDVFVVHQVKISATGAEQTAVLVSTTAGNIPSTIYTRIKAGGTWTAWSRQETTAGAQAKVDAATKAFGLGGEASTIPGADLNNIGLTGFYKGNNLVNAPYTSADYTFTVIHMEYGSGGNSATQIATLLFSKSETFIRTRNGGSWGAWVQLETTAGAQAKIEQTTYKVEKLNKDANGVFTTVNYYRKSDNTMAKKAVLSGGTSPQYTTRTITYYAADGTTVLKTDPFNLTYDADGELITEW